MTYNIISHHIMDERFPLRYLICAQLLSGASLQGCRIEALPAAPAEKAEPIVSLLAPHCHSLLTHLTGVTSSVHDHATMPGILMIIGERGQRESVHVPLCLPDPKPSEATDLDLDMFG